MAQPLIVREKMILVGVDGCRAGWVAIGDVDGAMSLSLFPDFDALLTSWAHADRIMVDVPIGLPSRARASRTCDGLARRALGRRASSVFTPPCRRAAAADSVAEARRENVREVGRSLSAQAWGICRKIVEVDKALRRDDEARRRVFEVHPELCFWSLAGHLPMMHAKRGMAGRQERLDLLNRWEPESARIVADASSRYLRRDLQVDDMLDALVALVTARAANHQLRSFPEAPEFDDQGLPMRMVYREGP